MSNKIITCVYCGQKYPANTPTWGKDVSVLTEHIKKCPDHPMRKVEAELAELQATFDLRWNADQRAIKMWQKQNPKRGNVWPDHADLVVWLMERDTNFRDGIGELAEQNLKLLRFVHNFLKWRSGPEGPEVLFAEGAKLVEHAKELTIRDE